MTVQADKERCGNTVHSDYVSDHQCQRQRGHVGDCWFGDGFAALAEQAETLRHRYMDEVDMRRDDITHERARRREAEADAAALRAKLAEAERERDVQKSYSDCDTQTAADAIGRAIAAERQLAEARDALWLWRDAWPLHRNECSPFSEAGCTCGLQAARDAGNLALASLEGGDAA